MELKELKGLGKARLETLNKAGITTLSDLLLTLPVRYQDTSVLTPLGAKSPRGWRCACRDSPRPRRA